MNKELTTNNQIQIIKDEKKVLDSRYNLLDEQKCCPQYYFADSYGNRLSSNYYSIQPLSDGIHYVVSELDFMYTLGLDSWKNIYGEDYKGDINFFKFHYGVVCVLNNEVTIIIPIVYNDIYETNSNVVFIKCDKKISFNHTEDEKLGCVNLDITSESYGMNIAPPIMDRIYDFDTEYKGFARAFVSDYEGFLSKEINVDNYDSYLNLLLNLKKGLITPKEYISKMKEAAGSILISEDEVKHLTSQPQKKLKS